MRATSSVSVSSTVRLKPDTTTDSGTSSTAGVPRVRPARSITNSATGTSDGVAGRNNDKIPVRLKPDTTNATAVSSASAPAATCSDAPVASVRMTGSRPPVRPRTASRPAKTSKVTAPSMSAVAAYERDGTIGNAAAISRALGVGRWALGDTRNKTTSCGRCSSDATSPLASVKVSVTFVCTTVPEGSAMGDCTTRVASAVPPVGGTLGGSTTPVLVAVTGSGTRSTPGSGSPTAGTGMGGSCWSATTKAKTPIGRWALGVGRWTVTLTAPSATGTWAATRRHTCVSESYSTKWTAGSTENADNQSGAKGVQGAPGAQGAAGSAVTLRTVPGVTSAVASAAKRRSNAASGDQPSGSTFGKPCCDRGVRWTDAGEDREPGGKDTDRSTALGAGRWALAPSAVTVPPVTPIVTGAASGVRRASRTTVPTAEATGTSRATVSASGADAVTRTDASVAANA